MREAITVFKQNRASVEGFLKTTVENLQLDYVNEENVKGHFNLLPFLEMVYMVDPDYIQVTPYFYKKRVDHSMVGLPKQTLFNKVKINDSEIFVSNPYISSHTGNACITLVETLESGYRIIFDFNLLQVLKQMRLIDVNPFFNAINTYIYGAIGFFLLAFSVILVGYSGFIFYDSLMKEGADHIKAFFSPIIALTLGLAIYDLARTILEQEVFYKSYLVEENSENRVLTKFLISIIIALSIESLMVVFKVALSDYGEMLNALYLIVGVSLLILSLGVFHHFTRHQQDCCNPSEQQPKK